MTVNVTESAGIPLNINLPFSESCTTFSKQPFKVAILTFAIAPEGIIDFRQIPPAICPVTLRLT